MDKVLEDLMKVFDEAERNFNYVAIKVAVDREKKIMYVTFGDNKVVKVQCEDGDTFSIEQGIMVATEKKIHRSFAKFEDWAKNQLKIVEINKQKKDEEDEVITALKNRKGIVVDNETELKALMKHIEEHSDIKWAGGYKPTCCPFVTSDTGFPIAIAVPYPTLRLAQETKPYKSMVENGYTIINYKDIIVKPDFNPNLKSDTPIVKVNLKATKETIKWYRTFFKCNSLNELTDCVAFISKKFGITWHGEPTDEDNMKQWCKEVWEAKEIYIQYLPKKDNLTAFDHGDFRKMHHKAVGFYDWKKDNPE